MHQMLYLSKTVYFINVSTFIYKNINNVVNSTIITLDCMFVNFTLLILKNERANCLYLKQIYLKV